MSAHHPVLGCNCTRCRLGQSADAKQPSPYSTPTPAASGFNVPPPPTCATWDPKSECTPKVDEGTKHDSNKVRTDLYPTASFLGTCRVLTHGAKKYAARNWEKGILYGRVYGALLRHLFAWWAGEDIDPESGEHHLDHAGCCIAFLQHYTKHPALYGSFDDRPRAETKQLDWITTHQQQQEGSNHAEVSSESRRRHQPPKCEDPVHPNGRERC